MSPIATLQDTPQWSPSTCPLPSLLHTESSVILEWSGLAQKRLFKGLMHCGEQCLIGHCFTGITEQCPSSYAMTPSLWCKRLDLHSGGLAHAAISLLSDSTSGHACPVTKCWRIVGIRLLWLSAATIYSPPPNCYNHISGRFSNQKNMFIHHNHPLFTLSHSPVDLGEAPQCVTLQILCQITNCPYGDKQGCMSRPK